MSQKRLLIDSRRCNGCGLCQLACAALRQGQWNPVLGRIKMIMDPLAREFRAYTCAQCQDPPCMLSCLMNVIYKERSTGVTLRHINGCIGCRVCELSCPFSAAVYDPVGDKVFSCDLCGGSPMCIEYCPQGALLFVDSQEEAERRREEAILGRELPDLIEPCPSSREEERSCG